MLVPLKWAGQDKRFADGLKENLDIICGHRGDPLDRAITARDLLESGMAKLPAGSTVFGGSSRELIPPTTIPDLTIPPKPTNLQADGAFQNILLSWDLPLYIGHAHVEIWRNTSNSTTGWALLATTTQAFGSYADNVGSGATFYYWVRAVNKNDRAGPYNSSAGTQGQTAPDIAFLITTLSNSITSSELAVSLSTPIAKIGPIESFVGYSSGYSGESLITRMGAVETVAGAAVTTALLTQSYSTTATTNQAIATATNGLVATATLNGYTTTAQLQQLYYTKTDANSAFTTAAQVLASSVANPDGTASTVALSQAMSTQANVNGTLKSQYSVKIDNNGHVSGFGLSSTLSNGTPSSAFIVRSDKFAVVNPTDTSAMTNSPSPAHVPFIVTAATNIDGVAVPAGAYMKSAFIHDGSITNARIRDAAIDNAKIANLSAEKITSGLINTSRLNIDSASLTSVNGVLQIGNVNVNKLTGTSISATIMSGTTVYANRLTGDVNKLLPFRSTTSVSFKGNAASGGGTVQIIAVQLPATTHLTVGHKPFGSITGWYDSTANKTYSFKLYMQLGSGAYQLVGETRFKANTNLYAQFAVSGSLATATTSTVNMKLEVTRTGSSGIYDSDTSATIDRVHEVSGFILGAR